MLLSRAHGILAGCLGHVLKGVPVDVIVRRVFANTAAGHSSRDGAPSIDSVLRRAVEPPVPLRSRQGCLQNQRQTAVWSGRGPDFKALTTGAGDKRERMSLRGSARTDPCQTVYVCCITATTRRASTPSTCMSARKSRMLSIARFESAARGALVSTQTSCQRRMFMPFVRHAMPETHRRLSENASACHSAWQVLLPLASRGLGYQNASGV